MKSPEEIEQALSRLMPAALRPAAHEAICSEIQDLAAKRTRVDQPRDSFGLPRSVMITTATMTSSPVTLSIVDDSWLESSLESSTNDAGSSHPRRAIGAETRPLLIPPSSAVASRSPQRLGRNAITTIAAACITLATGITMLLQIHTDGNRKRVPEMAQAGRAIASNTTGVSGNAGLSGSPTNVLIDRREQVESENTSQLVTDDDGTVHRAYRIRRTTEEKVRDSATGLVITVTEPRDEELLIPVNSF